MIKKVSLYKVLIALLVFSLFVPAGLASAQTNVEASLTVHKYEREPGAGEASAGNGRQNQSVPEDAVKLPGVTFEFTQTHAFNQATDEWTEVEGVPFTEVTNSEGEIVINNIPLGRFKVQEIDGPAHVNLNPDVYYVDVPMTNADHTSVTYDVHIFPKNETIRGAVELTKLAGETDLPLAGVTFDLYNDDGTLLQAGLVTNANGQIQVSDLVYGNYYFTEVLAASGYVLGDQHIAFSISESGVIEPTGDKTGEIASVNVVNYLEPELEKTIDQAAANRGEDVTYSIKTELPADISAYNNFEITDELDSRLAYVQNSWSVSGVDASAIQFTENGQLLNWEIIDFSAVADVTEIVISFEATVKEDAAANEVITNKAAIEYENKHGNGGEKETEEVPLIPTAGTVTLVKQDGDTKETLAGAVFELRDEAGNVLAEETTDSNGFIDFGELNYGAYTIHEVKAPTGYRKLVNPIEFTVDSEKSEHTFTVDNFVAGWDLPKTGGIGTTLFTLIGLTFMGLAFGLYFRRRRVID